LVRSFFDVKLLESWFMRITEAARRLGTSARMLRYREDLGLLPAVRDGLGRFGARGAAHRQFSEEDVEAVAAALALERRYDISPASLAFGLRVLAEPAVRASVADLGRRLGRIPAPASRALDFEKERALRLLQGG
jgi:MerR family transcriptional regulator, copper efflux regulator